MIQATVQQALTAFPALQRLSAVPLGAKAAWRLSRLLGKVKSVIIDFETTQKQIFLDAGGVVVGNQLSILEPMRNGQDDAAWELFMNAHKAKIVALTEQMNELMSESIEIAYEPIDIGLFGDAKVSANDLEEAGPFLKE